MARILLFFAFIFLQLPGQSQTGEKEADELTASSPMPRVNEPFYVSINISKLRESIFESMYAKIKNARINDDGSKELQLLSIVPEKTGPLEIGPIEYVVNNVKYTTNKLVVQVAEALPFTDTGIWITPVPKNEDEFCIIIEQRAPIRKITTNTEGGGMHISWESYLSHDNSVKWNHNSHIKGLSSSGTHSTAGKKDIEDENGNKLECMSTYTVCWFTITDPKARIKITEKDLLNLPAGYVFKDIIVQ